MHLYSVFINYRLSSYLEEHDLLSEEQNGFRKNGSCEDHVFTLNSVIRNNPNVIASFIDLKKAFDFVDRDMLLYKLLLNTIDGKLYNSIKSLYVQIYRNYSNKQQDDRLVFMHIWCKTRR